LEEKRREIIKECEGKEVEEKRREIIKECEGKEGQTPIFDTNKSE